MTDPHGEPHRPTDEWWRQPAGESPASPQNWITETRPAPQPWTDRQSAPGAPAYPPQYPHPDYPMPPAGPPPRKRGAVVIAAAAVVLVIAGAGVFLWSNHRDGPSDSAAGGTSVTHTSGATPSGSSVSLDGVWLGTYTCAQGATGLTLTVTADHPDEVEATFAFAGTRDNPSPPGSFTMSGTIANGVVSLTGKRWIDRPTGYIMVGLTAPITGSHPATLDGTVQGSGCSTFSVTRDNR